MEVMKKFISYYKPYKTVFFLDMFCALVISAVDLAFPQILSYRYYVTAQGHIMGARMESDMRQDLFDQFERLSFSYYDRNNTGEMMSKLVSDLFDISEFAHHGPENVFISLLKIIGSFLLLLYIHVPLTLILIAVTLVMLIFSMLQNKKMQATFMDNRRKIAGVNASLQDSLAGIRVVKSFANEDIERDKFSHSNQLFLQSKTNNYYRMGLFHAGNNFFQGMLYLTIRVDILLPTEHSIQFLLRPMPCISTSLLPRLRCSLNLQRCFKRAIPGLNDSLKSSKQSRIFRMHRMHRS